MKKVFFIAATAVVVSMGFSSCKRCQTCKKDSSPTVRVCEKDYASNTEYGLTLDIYQADGYECNRSI
jgi:hypothetical protein